MDARLKNPVTSAKRPWWRRIVRGVFKTIGWMLVAIAALVTLLLLSLDTSLVRGIVVKQVNALLAPMFRGAIHISRVGHLSLRGISGADVRILGADQTTVIEAHGVNAEIQPVTLVRSLLGKGPLSIEVFHIVVDAAEANLDATPDGTLKIQTAFESKEPPPPTPSPAGRPLRLSLPSITLTHAWVHGHPRGAFLVDADLDRLNANLLLEGDHLTIDLEESAITTRALPVEANPLGHLEAHLALPSKTGKSLGLHATFRGSVRQLPAHVDASLDGEDLTAIVDVPRVSQEQARTHLSDLPIKDSFALHAEARGPLSNLAITAHATPGPGTVDINAALSLTPELGGKAAVVATHIDLRSFSEGAPASTLGANVEASLQTKKDGFLFATYSVAVPKGAIGDNRIPSATMRGSFEQKAPKNPRDLGLYARGDVSIAEPGAPVAVNYDVHPKGDHLAIGFTISAEAEDLKKLTRTTSPASGRVSVSTTGTLDLTTPPSVMGTVHVEGTSIAYQTVHLDRVLLDTRVEGPLGHGDLPSARDTNLTLTRGAHHLGLRAARLHATDTRVDLESLTIEGVGAAMATAHLSNGSMLVKANSTGLNLTTIGLLLGQEKVIKGGSLAFAVDASASRSSVEGAVQIDLKDGSFPSVPTANGRVDVRLHERSISGNVHVEAGDLGRLDLNEMHVRVGDEGPFALSSWRRSWGRVDYEGEVDLSKLGLVLPPESLAGLDIAGHINASGRIVRRGAFDDRPVIRLSAKTRGLLLSRKAPASPDAKPKPVRPLVQGVDGQVDVRIDGPSDSTEVAVRAVDRAGAILALDVKSNGVPYPELLAHPQNAQAILEKVPFVALLTIPTRSFQQFPTALQPSGAMGSLDATVHVNGTLLDPKIDLKATGHSLSFDELSTRAPLEAEISGSYRDGTTSLTAELHTTKDKLLDAKALIHARVADLLHGSGEPIWDASVDASLLRFPLASLQSAASGQLRGRVTGSIKLTDLHKDARLTLRMDTENLRMGDVSFKVGHIEADANAERAKALVHLEQAEGSLNTTAIIPIHWGARVLPILDESNSAEVALKAHRLQLGFVQPFVAGAFSSLDGRLDADAAMSFLPGKTPLMHGKVTLKEGLIQAHAGGGEFHEVRGNVVLSTDGTLRLQDVSARGLTGRVTVEGGAHLNGFRLLDANAAVRINKDEAIPISLEGTSLGAVNGDIDIAVKNSEDATKMDISVTIPKLLVDLRQNSPNSVEKLDPPEQTRVGVRIGDRFVELPLEKPIENEPAPSPNAVPTETTIAIHLGDNVQVKRGLMLKVMLTGDPTVHLTDKTRMTGQIQLKEGRIDIKGKAFQIEKGTVTFLGDDPGNPVLAITAGWTAPDGTRVFADVIGPVKTMKVRLRSEPMRQQNEILALVLFGTASGSSTTPYAGKQASNSATAGAAVGGAATEGLSRGFDDLTGIEATAKVDTSDSANPRPEVEVQIAKDISLQVAFVLGTPPPGQNPDRTYATLGWRFIPNWLLATTFGDRGSSIADVIWQYRY